MNKDGLRPLIPNEALIVLLRLVVTIAKGNVVILLSKEEDFIRGSLADVEVLLVLLFMHHLTMKRRIILVR